MNEQPSWFEPWPWSGESDQLGPSEESPPDEITAPNDTAPDGSTHAPAPTTVLTAANGHVGPEVLVLRESPYFGRERTAPPLPLRTIFRLGAQALVVVLVCAAAS